MKKKKEPLVLAKILKKVAPSIGATVLMEPEYGIVCRVVFKNGKRVYFRYNTTDLNPMGSSENARDKDYANFFMNEDGYPIVPGTKKFYSEGWAKILREPRRSIDAAYAHACELGFPVIVKPNSGTQGSGVALVHNRGEFYRAMRKAFNSDRIVLVQRPIQGKDYRLVVLDDRIISAYERVPLSVVGDGTSTIRELLKAKQKEFIASGRDTQIKMNDPRIRIKLKHQGLRLESQLGQGKQIFLLDNANLSTGGDSIDVTELIHPEFSKLAIRLTKDMGLRLCGVDLIVEGDVRQKPDVYWVLEINSAPGLDHYAKSGEKQDKIVEGLYLELLRHLEERP